ncbi:tetratricopeptide repeat protein [Pseudidiomarina sp. CB1]|uniref:tetratricopeptide repeat protein n=1 Tax=Pseudidiomarina sp. CB1 TaxID=2972484 RepID=UPI0021615EE2|nr:tetratricopeptide repeat protein [Pseudidiomarina sp. CB1]
MIRSSVKLIGVVLFVGMHLGSVEVHADVTEGVTICQSGDCEAELTKLERFARKGSGDAAAVVAIAYASGDGVEQNLAKAQTFIERGASRRNPLAMFVLADWYAKGFVVQQDAEQAQLWLDRAAAENYAPAQYEKAVQLLAATNRTDQQAAVPLLEKAAEANLLTAMYALARLYQTGTLVEQDLPKAGALYARLARSGHTNARQQLRVVNQQLAPTAFAQSEQGERLQAAEQAMERITVTADASLYRTQLGRLVEQLEQAPNFDNRSIGSRIQGVGCGDTGSPCAVLRPQKGQSSLADVMSGSQGN